jgi:hypothetical protein
MAYVSLNDTNTRIIRHHIRQMYSSEMVTAGEMPSVEYTPEIERVYLIQQWGAERFEQWYSAIPKEWCSLHAECAVSIIPAEPEYSSRTLSGRLYFPSPVKLPPKAQSSGLTVYSDLAEVKELVSWYERVTDIKQRWDEVEDKVLHFLKNCKSVNEALKLWPSLEIYIPPTLLAKVREKVKRSAPEESSAAKVLQSIDVDRIQAAAVIARMAKAQE